MEESVRSPSALWVWVALFVLLTLVLLAGGYAYYRSETQRIRQEKYQEIAAIGKLKAEQIKEWREERRKDLGRALKAPFFRKAVEEWLRHPDNTALREELQHRLVVEQDEEGYSDVLLLDPKGRLLLSSQPQTHPLSPTTKKVIEQVLSNRAPLLSDLYRSPHGIVYLDAVAPIPDSAGWPIALLVLRSKEETLLHPLIQSWPTPSLTAETLLVRREGDELLFLNDLRHRPNSALSLREPLTLKTLPAQQAVLGRQGIFQGVDYRGEEVLADLRAIPGSPWFMVAKVDASEILAEARYRGGVIALFSVLFILLAAGVTAYSYRHRQVSLYRNLYRSERETRAAQEEFRTTLYSIGDAVITTDTKGLLKQMNPVAEEITGWQEAEARGKPLHEVFRIVHEESRDEVENPVKRVLREGLVVGLANHTLLIAKDGPERPIADSGAPIRDDRGAITGVVLVFRDQTEERRAHRVLQESEERYRDLWEKAPVMMISLDSQARIIFASDRFCEALGYGRDEVLGRRTFEFQTQDSARRAESVVFPGFMLSGQVKDEPLQFVKKNGDVIDVLLSATAERDAQGNIVRSRSVLMDVTDRKRAEEALRASESVLSSVIDQSPNPMWISDRQGTLIRTNEALLDLLHISEEEVVGKYNILSDNIVEEQGALPLVKSVFERGDTVRFEIKYDTSRLKQLQLKQSAFVILDVTVFPIKDSNGETTNAVIQHIDITERERAEEELRNSEERYRQLVEMSLDAIAVQQDGVLAFVNPAAARMIGAESPNELIGKPVQDLVHPDCWEPTKSRLQRMFQGETGLFPVENWYVRLDGTAVPVEVTASVLTYGDKPAVQVIARDITERKKAEAALRTSEAKLSNALEMAHLGHWEYDVIEDVFTFNDNFYKIFRTTAEEVGGYTMSSADYARRFVHPDDISVVGNEIRKSIEATDPQFSQQLEHRIIYADGEIGHISVKLFIVKDALGRTVRTFGVNQDITERKRAEDAVRESEERYRSLFENMVEGYAYCRMLFEDGEPQDFVYLDVNEAFERLTGLKNVIGKRVTELIPGIREANPEVFEVYGRVALTGNPEKLEAYVEPLGVWFSVSVYSTEREYFVAVFDNITERREAERALRFEREQLFSIFESINEVVIVIDPRTYEILYANKFAEDLYGKSLVGGHCYEKLNGLEEPCDHCVNEQVMSLKGKPYQWEYHNSALNRHFLATDRMIRWPDGRDVKFQLAIDITERKRAEQEKETLSSQLLQAQKMEAIGTLAGGVAHDFNNLLQVVLGYSELILSDEHFDSRYRDDLNKILQAAQNGAELVQQLLIFGRKTETKPKPLNLNRQIDQARRMLGRTIPKMIEIDLILANDLATVHVDPVQMDQILMNLAVNARDAMPDGGKLVIETRNVSLDEEYCHAHLGAEPGDYVLMSLSDAGHGMDKDTLEHIFEPFYTTKRPGEGTGLGLAMVYGIVKQHNGHIMCYSEPGRGTTFKIYFPAEVSEIEYQREHPRSVSPGGTETILLVDDESLLQELGDRILTKAGYAVLVAGNGREALEVYRNEQERIGLVILDLIMPEMGGKQCLEELLRINSDAKVLIASGYSASASTEETTEIGARGFVAKPYDVRQLLETVRNVLDS